MTFFDFAVRRLRFLARIPLFPQVFNSLLLAWTFLRHRDRLRAIAAIEAAAIGIEGVRLTVHKFGGIGFTRNGRELGHIHGNGLLDVLVGASRARELIIANGAEPHHVFGKSAWISYWVKSPADVPHALDLLQCAKAAQQVSGTSMNVPADD